MIRVSLEATDLRIAKLKRDDRLATLRLAAEREEGTRPVRTFGDAIRLVQAKLLEQPDLKPKTLRYYREIITTLNQTLPTATLGRNWKALEAAVWWKTISEESRARYQRAVDNQEKFDPSRHKNGDSSMHNSPMEVPPRAAAKVAEKGTRNKRSVWTVPTMSFDGIHFATYPPDLIKPCILAGCPLGGTILDPFGGSGTRTLRHPS